MKKYEAPRLTVDVYAADTMITSGGIPKNGNAGNNQNCWGCDQSTSDVNGNNACTYLPGTDAYRKFC